MTKNTAKKVFVIALMALCLWSVSGSAVLAVDFSGGLVNCGKGTAGPLDCNFAKAVEMINTLINWLIMIAMPLAAVAFAYAGWLYLTAGGESGIEKSKKVFMSVGIGLAVILSGWLIFKLIETTFLSSDYIGKTYLN